jgi:hypothetical protein
VYFRTILRDTKNQFHIILTPQSTNEFFVGRLQCQNNITVYDKLPLVGMQLLEKFNNFDVFSERKSLRRAFARNVEILLIFFRYSSIRYQRKLVTVLALPTLRAQTVRDNNSYYIYMFIALYIYMYILFHRSRFWLKYLYTLNQIGHLALV